MKLFKFLFLTLFIVLIGGFSYLSFSDIQPTKSELSITVPNDRFFHE